ncbi:ABC-3 protein [Halothece sp. PCC 7418]|uniref:metal ABC transporter permease n=1 Tax=Halothece sp. (strain PCC 7418) TaxID=65093 RepID=UPI0002A087D6|nr:metal ABC transporter permease [Halothece sp. PCC 7418]AFZ45713.1 ABC-3 protein [Halothece sp. PCC 7418]
MDILIEPLQYSFMQRSLLTAILVGIICASVGTYLMVQRLALLGEAVSHSVLPGLAIAFILGIDIFVGAFIAGVISAVMIAWVRTRSPIKEDAAMGIIYSAFFSLGITLISIVQKNNKVDLLHFLFGNILGVTTRDVVNTAVITVLVLTVIVLFYKELLFYTFDPEGAQAAGLPIHLLDLGLIILMSLTIVASLTTVGLALVVAMLITPGATAYLLVKRLQQMMIFGSVIGVIASISGMYLSYYFNLPSGPAIVMVAFGCFMLAFLFSPTHGILTHPNRLGSGQSQIWREIKGLIAGKQ